MWSLQPVRHHRLLFRAHPHLRHFFSRTATERTGSGLLRRGRVIAAAAVNNRRSFSRVTDSVALEQYLQDVSLLDVDDVGGAGGLETDIVRHYLYPDSEDPYLSDLCNAHSIKELFDILSRWDAEHPAGAQRPFEINAQALSALLHIKKV